MNISSEQSLGYQFVGASAGTGKTYRIEQLVLQWIRTGIPINKILIVTFTRAATRELSERIYRRLHVESGSNRLIETAFLSFGEAKIMTIHGFCHSMLSKFFLESRCLLNVFQEEELWKVWLDFLKSKELASICTPEELGDFFGDIFLKKFWSLVQDPRNAETTHGEIEKRLRSAFHIYRTERGENGITPNDLILAMRDALQNEPFIRSVQEQFSAAVIDEFQDTDAIQWEIFYTLFCKERILKAFCVVGDPKQSIYGFRNADLYTYYAARDYFAPAEQLSLETNYRSDPPLISALNALFTSFCSDNWMHLPKTGQLIEVPPLLSGKESDPNSLVDSEPRLRIVRAQENDEILYRYIARVIPFWIERGIQAEEIAILVKNRYEARALIEILEAAKIKAHYTCKGQISESSLFEGVEDFLLLLGSPQDPMKLKRVLGSSLLGWSIEQLERGDFNEIKQGLHHLLNIFQQYGLIACLWEFFESRWADGLSIAEKLLQNDELDAYQEFRQIIDLLCDKKQLHEARFFLSYLRKQKFFEHEEWEKRSCIDPTSITVTTIFQSKGLEYDIVFPLALATDRNRKDEDAERIAEKMRLFYVAMTRARQYVYLPHLEKRDAEHPSITEQFLSHGDPQQLYMLPYTSVEEIEDTLFYSKAADLSTITIPPPTIFSREFPHRSWSSFSSFAEQLHRSENSSRLWQNLSDQTAQDKSALLPERGEVPMAGALFGREVHLLLQEIFALSLHHPYNQDAIIERTRPEILPLIEGVFHTPLIPSVLDRRAFTLKEIAKIDLIPEMEFVYEHEGSLIKGFIDLIFYHEGFYYIVDWKTNWLPEYSPEQLTASISANAYDIQAKIYRNALQRYVSLFDQRPFDDLFGGAHYLYLRGMQWKRVLS